MKKLFLLSTLILSLLTLFPKDTLAHGLDIDTGVADGKPIFVVENMLPGDSEIRSIKVKNYTKVSQSIFVFSEKTDEIKNFSKILDFTINDGAGDIYNKKLKDFFVDSNAPTGLLLGSVAPSQTKTFKFKAYFPKEAENEYQKAKVVFDLKFSNTSVPKLLINEVYYYPDSNHGFDSPKDRRVINEGCSFNFLWFCKNTQNHTNCLGETWEDIWKMNFFCGCCQCHPIKNDEWVELYNAGQVSVNLKYWVLKDNSKRSSIIFANEILKPGEFALIAKSATTWTFWNENPSAKKISLGHQIGDGLDNGGDHLYLLSPQGKIIDSLGWKNDTTVWNPAIEQVSRGSSIERNPTGFDTNAISDWISKSSPTPGN